MVSFCKTPSLKHNLSLAKQKRRRRKRRERGRGKISPVKNENEAIGVRMLAKNETEQRREN